MNKIRVFLATSALAVLALTITPTAALGQSSGQQLACGEEREVDPGTLSEAVYRRLNDIFEMIGEKNFSEAETELRDMADGRLSEYERASVYQALGFIGSQKEDYAEAVDYFQKAIDLNVMPNQPHFEMILQTAQLYNAMEQYDEALEQLDYWFCVSTEKAQKQARVWVLKASLHIQKDEFPEALSAIEKAIALADEPKESWYRLKLGMHFELEQFQDAVDTLKILVKMDPERKSYWIQLSGSYMELNENAKAMSALRLAYRKGLLDKGSEYTQLAGLLQEMKAPRQAAEVLEAGIEKGLVEATSKNWEMAAGAWYQAREEDNALDAYEKAGAKSDEGQLDFQRASIYASQENWPKVLEAARRALDKGDLKRRQECNAYLLIGMSLFNTDRLNEAEQAFNRAGKCGKLESAAQQWLNQIQQTRRQNSAN